MLTSYSNWLPGWRSWYLVILTARLSISFCIPINAFIWIIILGIARGPFLRSLQNTFCNWNWSSQERELDRTDWSHFLSPPDSLKLLQLLIAYSSNHSLTCAVCIKGKTKVHPEPSSYVHLDQQKQVSRIAMFSFASVRTFLMMSNDILYISSCLKIVL